MNFSPSVRLLGGVLLTSTLALVAAAQPAPAAPAAASSSLEAYEQFGSTVARSAGITDLTWTDGQFAAFIDGLRAAHEKRPIASGEPGRQLLADIQRRLAEVRARDKAAQDPNLAKFMQTAQVGVGMQKTDSGLLCRLLMPGSGPRPRGACGSIPLREVAAGQHCRQVTTGLLEYGRSAIAGTRRGPSCPPRTAGVARSRNRGRD